MKQNLRDHCNSTRHGDCLSVSMYKRIVQNENETMNLYCGVNGTKNYVSDLAQSHCCGDFNLRSRLPIVMMEQSGEI